MYDRLPTRIRAWCDIYISELDYYSSITLPWPMTPLPQLQQDAHEKLESLGINVGEGKVVNELIASAFQAGKDAAVDYLESQSTSYIAQGIESTTRYDVSEPLFEQARSV